MRGKSMITMSAGVLMLALTADAQDTKKVSVTGSVVDAACFMIHPDAATVPSHRECGDACVARGVPLAIVNEADGQLYFAADAKQLASFHQKRVTATGTSVHKTEPMELKMPVGNKKQNEMVVKVTGGYNLLTVDAISAAPKK